jgi:Transglutaminase-like superfamily
MLAWRAIMPLLKRVMSLPRLVELMDAGPANGDSRSERQGRIADISQRVFNVFRIEDNCLDLSLVTYRYLAKAGADPRLVIAVRKDGQLTRGHAWVTVAGVPVHDSTERLGDFTSLMTFQPGGPARASEVRSDANG